MGQLCRQHWGALVRTGEGEMWLSTGRFLGEKLFPSPATRQSIGPPDVWHTGLSAALPSCICDTRHAEMMMMMMIDDDDDDDDVVGLDALVIPCLPVWAAGQKLYRSPPCSRRPAQQRGGPGAARSEAELCVRGSCRAGR